MKKTAWSLLLPALLLSTGVMAKDRVKCHVTLENGEQTIRVTMVDNAKGSTQFLHSQVSAQQVFMADGRTRVSITDVHECVHPEQEFRRRESREIARTVPR